MSRVGSTLTGNMKTRVLATRRVLAEAGVPAAALPVLAHSDQTGTRPDVMVAAERHVHPALLRYLAAHHGLLHGSPSVVAFNAHPSGPDKVHVIHTGVPQAEALDTMRKAGFPRFTLHRGTVYLFDPGGDFDMSPLLRPLNASQYHAIPGHGRVVGAGEGAAPADQRASYRSAIDEAEQLAASSARAGDPQGAAVARLSRGATDEWLEGAHMEGMEQDESREEKRRRLMDSMDWAPGAREVFETHRALYGDGPALGRGHLHVVTNPYTGKVHVWHKSSPQSVDEDREGYERLLHHLPKGHGYGRFPEDGELREIHLGRLGRVATTVENGRYHVRNNYGFRTARTDGYDTPEEATEAAHLIVWGNPPTKLARKTPDAILAHGGTWKLPDDAVQALYDHATGAKPLTDDEVVHHLTRTGHPAAGRIASLPIDRVRVDARRPGYVPLSQYASTALEALRRRELISREEYQAGFLGQLPYTKVHGPGEIFHSGETTDALIHHKPSDTWLTVAVDHQRDPMMGHPEHRRQHQAAKNALTARVIKRFQEHRRERT